MQSPVPLRVALGFALLCAAIMPADAAVIQFFDAAQPYSVTAGVTSDTYASHGYVFNCTRDKLFTGGTGHVIGRQVLVPWPEGAEGQAVTTPPPGQLPQGAQVTIKRVDGDVFDLTAFTAKLLASTAGAGGNFEVMPQLNGEDAFADPLAFYGTGIAGNSFSFDGTTPAYWGNTSLLKGYDTYKVGIYVDFALTALTLDGAYVPDPGDADASGRIDMDDFFRIDRGFANHLAGFVNGDFDYSGGPPDAQDYFIIDSFFAAQPGLLSSPAASVPEPATGILLALAASTALPRRRHARRCA